MKDNEMRKWIDLIEAKFKGINEEDSAEFSADKRIVESENSEIRIIFECVELLENFNLLEGEINAANLRKLEKMDLAAAKEYASNLIQQSVKDPLKLHRHLRSVEDKKTVADIIKMMWNLLLAGDGLSVSNITGRRY